MQIIIFCFFLGMIFSPKTCLASWWEMTSLEVREKINERILSIEAATPLVCSVVDRTIECEGRATPVRIYLPNQTKGLPVILCIHGGAWVAGNLDTHDHLARYLCKEAEAIVVSVGYLNAPEGKFPLQLQQCRDALLWIQERGAEFDIDFSRIAVLGDSAGGNMAAALCLLNRDQRGPKISCQVLVNPATDLTCAGTIEKQGDALDTLRWQALQYVMRPCDVYNGYVSPLVARDLSHLPEALIILAENDDLRETGQQYAKKLESSGVMTTVYCQSGIGHLAGHGARASLQARPSLDVAINFLKSAFSRKFH